MPEFRKNRYKNSGLRKTAQVHLQELRKTLKACLIIIIAGMSLSYGLLRDSLMGLFTDQLNNLNGQIIYTGITEAFITELKVSLLAGVLITSPVLGYIIWRFVSPAFFSKERKVVVKYALISVLLFIAGSLFCYFEMIPLVLRFFLNNTVVRARAMLTIGEYVHFLFKMVIPFGIVFETPMITYLLLAYHLISIERLKQLRKFVFLGCFILGAILTPPDIISQLFVALPMYLLYESGILFGKLFLRREKTVCSD